MQGQDPYKRLAERLDALPEGFPATESGVELRLLAELFTPDDADLAVHLRPMPETAAVIAARAQADYIETRAQLKSMARRGLIHIGRVEGALGYALMPFVVGIYESQLGRVSPALAQLFEQYYFEAFGQMLALEPLVHRVIPIEENIDVDMEIHPFESATALLDRAEAWGVLNCICRKQKAEIGEGCEHPVEVCLQLSNQPGAFDHHPAIKPLTRGEAGALLTQAAEAGLVHTVGNRQHGLSYICNCCTCSCGILRGIADLGIANVVARSAFVMDVDEMACIGCEECLPYCQFDALHLNGDFIAEIVYERCVGCGVCATFCEEEALGLVRRPAAEVKAPPPTHTAWSRERAHNRGIDVFSLL